MPGLWHRASDPPADLLGQVPGGPEPDPAAGGTPGSRHGAPCSGGRPPEPGRTAAAAAPISI